MADFCKSTANTISTGWILLVDVQAGPTRAPPAPASGIAKSGSGKHPNLLEHICPGAGSGSDPRRPIN